jgi:hypothetical protein
VFLFGKFSPKKKRHSSYSLILSSLKITKQQIQITEFNNPIGFKKTQSSGLHTTLFCWTQKFVIPFKHFCWSSKILTNLPNPNYALNC